MHRTNSDEVLSLTPRTYHFIRIIVGIEADLIHLTRHFLNDTSHRVIDREVIGLQGVHTNGTLPRFGVVTVIEVRFEIDTLWMMTPCPSNRNLNPAQTEWIANRHLDFIANDILRVLAPNIAVL